MKSYLKKKRVKIEGLGGEEIEIIEMSAKTVNEMQQFKSEEQQQHVLLFVVKAGVPAWAGEADEEILSNVSMGALTEIVRAVNALSGLQISDEDLAALPVDDPLRKKNSGTNPTDSSSSDSPLS